MAASNTVPRLILAGISGYGSVYLRLLQQAEREGLLRLVAVVAINRAEIQEKCDDLVAHGVAVFDSWADLLSAKVVAELCVLPVPIHLHESMACEAMQAGYNVVLEKPLTGSVAQAETVLRTEAATGKWVAVGYQDFYHPVTAAICRDLARGRLGRIKDIRWTGFWMRGEAYFRRNSWAGKLSAGGMIVRDSPLNNAMAHFLNLSLCWAMAQPALSVTAAPAPASVPQQVEAELYRCNAIESFDTAAVRITCSSGVQIFAGVTHACSETGPVTIQVRGEEGDLSWVHQQGAVWSDGERLEAGSHDQAHWEMIRAVLRRLEDPDTRICTVRDAMAQVLCIEQLHAAAPIVELGPDQWIWGPDKTAPMRCLPGIEAVLERCVAEGALPRELGLSFTTSPAPQKSVAHAGSGN